PGAAPRSSAPPAQGCNSPPRIDSSVLLPQPEGPTIATTSPAPTVNDTSSSTSSAPKRWLIWSAIKSIPGACFRVTSVIPGWCVSTRPGISRFRVRCFASPRNDGLTNIARLLPLPIDECLHQALGLVGEERLSEHADAQIHRFLQRQFLPLAQQHLLRA